MRLDDGTLLLKKIGLTSAKLRAEYQDLVEGELEFKRDEIMVVGAKECAIDRTLVVVRDQTRSIMGWLFVFRDLTEEKELAPLREELVHMLVHDLRFPLIVLPVTLRC